MLASTIDGHQLVSEIARGAFSRVFRARTPAGADVALKLLEDGSDAVRSSGLRREYRFLSMLAHRCIPTVHKLGRLDDGRLYEVMELLQGNNLRNLLRHKKNWVLESFPKILKDIGAALSAVHGKNLVHCDVKPENIVVSPEGRAYLIDFASTRSRSDWYRFWEKVPRDASPSYIAPEQIRGRRPTHAADVYSLGILVFEMLAGRTAFTGVSVKALYEAHLRRPAPSLETLVPGISHELAKQVMLALDKSPERRPVDVNQWCFRVAGSMERCRLMTGESYA